MKLTVILSLCIGLLAGAPATASLIPIYPYSYYGPLTVCRDGFAFEVGPDAGHSSWGSLHLPRTGGLLVESLIYDLVKDADIVHPRGAIDVAGTGRFARVELTSRNSPSREIGYLYETGERKAFPRLVIRAEAFDGTDADAALLARVIVGERAKTTCAVVPPDRALRPERIDDRASIFRPTRPSGPLTLCWAGAAIDVRREERGLLAWRTGALRAGIETGGMTMMLDGGPRERLAQTGPLVDAGFTVEEASGNLFTFNFHTTSITRTARLTRQGNAGDAVDVAFLGPVDADRAGLLLSRIRARIPTDSCYNPDNL